MQPEEFKNWRKSQGLRQKEAAELLGLKKRVIQYYEKGKRDGKNVDIPKAVELACFAISIGVRSFDGTDAAMMKKPDIAEAHDDFAEILPAESETIAAE